MPEEFSLFDGEVITPMLKAKDKAVHPDVSAAARTLALVKSRLRANADAQTGMTRAEGHANRVTPEWSARADELFMEYATLQARDAPSYYFLTEDVRLFAQSKDLENPPDGRAWGAVAQRLHRLGKIEQGPPARANSSNRCFKPTWRAAR